MNRTEPLLELTKKLFDVLEGEINLETRDGVIEDAKCLLDERGRIISEILPPYTAEEQAIGQEIVRLDESIQTKMDKLFTAVKADIITVKRQKKTNTSYTNPYQQAVGSDGMFMDHKK